MKDQFERNIEYIRISVTDRCNLRCAYCMPEDGVKQVPHEEILTYDEIIRLCTIFAKLGITKVKLTGGEPLARKGIGGLIQGIKGVEGIESVTLTTNGVDLKSHMKELYRAGIDAVNVSLDTLEREMFLQITRRDKLLQVLAGIEEALKYPSIHLKINCVPLAGVNEDQWAPLAAFARKYPIDVRFIEMMPIGLGKKYGGRSQEDIVMKLEAIYGKSRAVCGNFGNGPGTYIMLPHFKGRIGFISAMSHQFCGTCNRVRLTSEGYLKMCLQYEDGAELKKLMRDGVDDKCLKELIKQTIYRKPKRHHFCETEGIHFEQKKMFQIGG